MIFPLSEILSNPLPLASSVGEFFRLLPAFIALYAFFLLPLTLVCYWLGKFLLWKRIEHIDNRLRSTKLESDTLRRVIGETADQTLAEKSLLLARSQAIVEKLGDCIQASQDWPYDSFREGVFWRPVRFVVHFIKAARIEWLAVQVRKGIGMKSGYEKDAINRLERYQNTLAGSDEPDDSQNALAEKEQELDENLENYEKGVLLVRQSAEKVLVTQMQADFEKAQDSQNKEFKVELQDLEDRLLKDEIQQRQRIADMLADKENHLAGIRHKIADAENDRKQAEDDRMSRVWKLLEEEK